MYTKCVVLAVIIFLVSCAGSMRHGHDIVNETEAKKIDDAVSYLLKSFFDDEQAHLVDSMGEIRLQADGDVETTFMNHVLTAADWAIIKERNRCKLQHITYRGPYPRSMQYVDGKMTTVELIFSYRQVGDSIRVILESKVGSPTIGLQSFGKKEPEIRTNKIYRNVEATPGLLDYCNNYLPGSRENPNPEVGRAARDVADKLNEMYKKIKEFEETHKIHRDIKDAKKILFETLFPDQLWLKSGAFEREWIDPLKKGLGTIDFVPTFEDLAMIRKEGSRYIENFNWDAYKSIKKNETFICFLTTYQKIPSSKDVYCVEVKAIHYNTPNTLLEGIPEFYNVVYIKGDHLFKEWTSHSQWLDNFERGKSGGILFEGKEYRTFVGSSTSRYDPVESFLKAERDMKENIIHAVFDEMDKNGLQVSRDADTELGKRVKRYAESISASDSCVQAEKNTSNYFKIAAVDAGYFNALVEDLYNNCKSFEKNVRKDIRDACDKVSLGELGEYLQKMSSCLERMSDKGIESIDEADLGCMQLFNRETTVHSIEGLLGSVTIDSKNRNNFMQKEKKGAIEIVCSYKHNGRKVPARNFYIRVKSGNEDCCTVREEEAVRTNEKGAALIAVQSGSCDNEEVILNAVPDIERYCTGGVLSDLRGPDMRRISVYVGHKIEMCYEYVGMLTGKENSINSTCIENECKKCCSDLGFDPVVEDTRRALYAFKLELEMNKEKEGLFRCKGDITISRKKTGESMCALEIEKVVFDSMNRDADGIFQDFLRRGGEDAIEAQLRKVADRMRDPVR